MMTLELEYFFLCSVWRDRCHAPQRVGPSLVGLDPQEAQRRTEMRVLLSEPLTAIREDAGWKVALRLLWGQEGSTGGPLAWPYDRPPWGPEASEDRDLFRACWGWGAASH